jgi:myo-inositol-1-phosphate synthase
MVTNKTQLKKIGLWIIGARGSIAATVMIGALALRKGLTQTKGMVTATTPFAGLGLMPVKDLVFGGCDIRNEPLIDSVRRVMQEGAAIDPAIFAEISSDLETMDSDISPGTVRNCGAMIQSLAESEINGSKTLLEEIDTIRKYISSFRQRHRLDTVVVINLASTEPSLTLTEVHNDIQKFEDKLKADVAECVQASTLYAYASILEQCPYINFTPSNAALLPALIKLAEMTGVPVMGNDGKTGETLVKSALAPLFLSRNLDILSWEGVNMLGNMDGQVLNDPDNCESKLKSKDQVLQKILGYAPHSKVHIHYVPSLADQKTAWDLIHFQGFLGAKMSLQFTWQGYDSILAAPLVLDLVRLAELAKRRGEAGLMPHLASFFKAPIGVEEYKHTSQFEMLLEYVGKNK